MIKNLRNKYLTISLIFMALFFFSLRVVIENSYLSFDITQWSEKKIYLPICDSSIIKSDSFSNTKIKIVSFLDGNCGVCIHDFLRWKNFVREYNINSEVEILIYVNTYNYDGLIETLNPKEFSQFVFINDTNNIFFKINKLEDDKMYHTFLLDSNNKVLIIGSPILNENIKYLYLNTINEILSDSNNVSFCK